MDEPDLRKLLERRNDEFNALLDATKKLQDDRDRVAAENAEHRKLVEELGQRITELEAINKQLTNSIWGRRSERREDPNQQHLFADLLEAPDHGETDDDANAEVEDAQATLDEALIKAWEERRRKAEARRKKTPRNETFPEHMERRERVIDLPEAEKDGLKYIGDAVSERMRFERPHAYIERIIRRKYVQAGKPECGVQSASAPLAIVEGCRYGFDVIASMIAMKYAFHQPTYRQQDYFAQSGWFPQRSTINDMLNHSVDTVDPLYELMWQRLLEPSIVHVDETPARLLTRDSLSDEQHEVMRRRKQKKKKKKPPNEADHELDEPGSVTSYAWIFSGLDDFAPYNVFQWSLSRSHTALDAWLATHEGTLVADAYEAYTNIEKRSGGRIVHASCNVHARRGFINAESYAPTLCAEANAFYRRLFAIEERGSTLSPEQRHELRQQEALPIWAELEEWLNSKHVKSAAALPKSPFGKAVGYLKNQWHSLQLYLRDGQTPMHNNTAEGAIRPLAVGRRNWLFFGHPQAAAGRLKLISIVSSAHRHNLIIEDYLQDVLEKLAYAHQNNPELLKSDSEYLASLLPDRWAADHPNSIRTERVREKADRAEEKRVRRARQRLKARKAKRRKAR